MSDEVQILLVEDNPDDVKLALYAFKKHNLTDHVHVARDGADVRGVDRHVAPAHHALALGGDRLVQDRLACRARLPTGWQEHLADREPPAISDNLTNSRSRRLKTSPRMTRA